jgi:hypothetical protein
MMSLRTDFLGNLHADKPLFEVRHQIDVPPLGGGSAATGYQPPGSTPRGTLRE